MSVLCDGLGGELTTESTTAAAAFGRAVTGLLGHRRDTADHLNLTLAADPELAAVHCLRGFGLRSLARRDLLPAARAALEHAQRSIASRGATSRERRLVS